MQIINANDKIIKNEEGKEPFIALTKLDASSVNIVVRVWVNPADYWVVNFKMNEDVYKEFSKQGLNIPFPQMDVHVISQN
jgi:small conductance mechanosensitive channel